MSLLREWLGFSHEAEHEMASSEVKKMVKYFSPRDNAKKITADHCCVSIRWYTVLLVHQRAVLPCPLHSAQHCSGRFPRPVCRKELEGGSSVLHSSSHHWVWWWWCVYHLFCVCASVCVCVCVFIYLFIYDDGSCWWWCIVNKGRFAWLINCGQLTLIDLFFIHVANDARRYWMPIMSCCNNTCLQHSCCIWTCVAEFNQDIKYMRKQLDAFFSSWLESHLGSVALPVCTSSTLSSAWSCTDTGEPFLLGWEDVSPKKCDRAQAPADSILLLFAEEGFGRNRCQPFGFCSLLVALFPNSLK